MNRLFRLFQTLRHLKTRQIVYRGYYLLRKRVARPALPGAAAYPDAKSLIVVEPVPRHRSLSGDGFVFLNRQHRFPDRIDWEFADFGKLWAYNLNYFDFLNQHDMESGTGLGLIRDFSSDLPRREVGLEPYPTSLRIMNWTKFLAVHRVKDDRIEQALYRQALHLMAHLEYHLLGNHLLENGFALLFAAALFPEGPFSGKARQIVAAELQEQILADGAHFELSPMYHQIILDRLLDCINLLQSCQVLPDLLPLLRDKASIMLGWLQQVALSDSDIPLLNDSASGIAPATSQLLSYAQRLGVPISLRPLGASGYRSIRRPGYQMLVDVGGIGPDYIPGHAHSDTFSFVLHVQGRPVIVDTGTSTYETCQRRLVERGTAAHNTVQVDGLDQSEVWGSFRVARRAYVRELQEEQDRISAWHDGYCRIGARHARTFRFGADTVQLQDTVASPKKHELTARIHFHPDVDVALEDDCVLAGPLRIRFAHADSVALADYDYAPEFNTLIPARKVEIRFSDSLITDIAIGQG